MLDHVAKVSNRNQLNVLTPKQMLQILPITLVQVKVCNTSEDLLNETIYIVYSLYRPSKFTKKVNNNIMNSIKFQNKMNTIFMNSKSSATSYLHRLLLNLTHKINLKIMIKYVALLTLSIYFTWKNIKKSYDNNKSKISAPTRDEAFELTDGPYSVSNTSYSVPNSYLIIQEYLEHILKKHREKINNNINPSIRIHVI